MEEKPDGSSAAVEAAAADSPASAEPASSSRRRAGGHKRKANALSASGFSSTQSKRLTREKAVISQSPIHNGPLTRARQGPSNLASSVSSGTAAGVKLEENAAAAAAAAADVSMVAAARDEEGSKLEELEAAMEAEFEAIRSRDCNPHVVPSHCGWFSWTKIHSVEERTLPSFFNGKSQVRTPDVYMEIRNWIMKKFHANPSTSIEVKDLSDLEVGDADARQEVLEFLDYWGLINFHPFLQTDSGVTSDGSVEIAKDNSVLEKLFRFDDIQPCTPNVPTPSLATPSMPSRLFPESAIAEELIKAEGPAVEYHCNSCSADCSRKRYHCQKEADYDLCADCFSNAKFGSNMSSSDFILMEPAEAPGLSGGKWTDQETLLLLEALELYKENWNEIAEHVATKTKAQCILHFVQMPIEDTFFDCDDDMSGTSKEIAEPAAVIDETPVSQEAPEDSESKTGSKEEQPQTSPSPVEPSKPEDASEVKACPETGKSEDNIEVKAGQEVVIGQETSKVEDDSEVKAVQEVGENFPLKALTEAFEAVGCLQTPENHLSFAEVGNPVMALGAFLARLVGPEVATASARSSLKSLSCSSPSMQLAAKHCFLLEDPPDGKKEQSIVDCVANEMADWDSQKDRNEDENQKENLSTTVLCDGDMLNDIDKKSIEDPVAEGKKPLDSSNDESSEKVNNANEASTAVTQEEVGPSKLKGSGNSELAEDYPPGFAKETVKTPSKSDCPPSSVEELQGESPEVHSNITMAAKDVDIVPDLKPSEKKEPHQIVVPMCVDEPTSEAPKDVDAVSDLMRSDKSEQQVPVKSISVGEQSQPSEASHDVDMSSVPSELNEPKHLISPYSVVENKEITVNDPKETKKEKPDRQVIKDDSIDRIKRAAVAALSAAAVKAKVLANQEEDQIRQLAAFLIEKQLHKLDMKLAFFNDMDGVIARVKEQLDRSRQRLYHERAQIIATRLGLPANSSRAIPPPLPANRIAMTCPNSLPRPPMIMASQRPPISRSMGILPPNTSNPFVSPSTAGNSIRPSGQDISSVGMK